VTSKLGVRILGAAQRVLASTHRNLVWRLHLGRFVKQPEQQESTMDTMALTEISIEALDTVNGGWAREGLRNAGEKVGGAIDDTGNALIAGAQWTGSTIAAGARFLGNAAVATGNAVRTGVANGLDAVGNGFKSAGDFVRPACR
jgi:hypothetical protein